MNKRESIEYWKRITRFVSGEMGDIEKEQFGILAKEMDDRKLLDEVEKDMKNMEMIKEDYKEKTDNAWAKLHSRLEQDELIPKESSRRILNLGAFSKIAAVLIIAVGLTYAGMQLMNQKLSTDNYLAVTELEQTRVVLSDGTEVFLNGNSKLTYPKSFSKNERRVQLKGEAFFNVTKNPNSPFIIEACDAEIKVLGTSFNVLTESNTKNVEVLVESGLVKLSHKGGEEKGILLEKGEYAVLEKEKIEKTINSDDNYLSWRTKELFFRELNIQEVVEILNRTYAENIQLDLDESREYNLTSTYDNVELDTILESICITFNLNLKEEKGNIVLGVSKN